MLINDHDLLDERARWRRIIVDRCPVCGGKGYVLVDGDGGIPRSRACACVARVRRNVRLVDHGLPRKFLEDRWNLDLLRDRSYGEIIERYVADFETNLETGRGLFLTGPHGRGKTTISCIVAKLVAERRHPWRRLAGDEPSPIEPAFIVYNDVIAWRFADDQVKRQALEWMIGRSDLLILDNVGNEMGRNERGTSQRMLEMILRERDNARLPVILATNLSADELATTYSPDVRDFVLQNCTELFVAGDNHREAAGQRRDEFDF